MCKAPETSMSIARVKDFAYGRPLISYRRLNFRDSCADPESTSTSGFFNLHPRHASVQNWGFYFLDSHVGLSFTNGSHGLKYGPLPSGLAHGTLGGSSPCHLVPTREPKSLLSNPIGLNWASGVAILLQGLGTGLELYRCICPQVLAGEWCDCHPSHRESPAVFDKSDSRSHPILRCRDGPDWSLPWE